MIIRGNVLESNGRVVTGTVTLKKIRGFIVDALIRGNDPVVSKEISSGAVGTDKIGLLATFKGFSMDIISTVHDEDILGPTLGGNGKTSRKVRMSNFVDIDDLSIHGSAVRGARSGDRMPVAISFI